MNQKTEQQKNRGHARESPFFADRWQHEIGVARWDHRWIAPARSGSPSTTGGKSPQRVRQLVAAVNIVVPRREPHVDALHNGGWFPKLVSNGDATHQQRDAEQHQYDAPTHYEEDLYKQ